MKIGTRKTLAMMMAAPDDRRRRSRHRKIFSFFRVAIFDRFAPVSSNGSIASVGAIESQFRFSGAARDSRFSSGRAAVDA